MQLTIKNRYVIDDKRKNRCVINKKLDISQQIN